MNNDTPQRSRRRWLQYGLRSLMLLMLACSLLGGWYHWFRRPYAEQRKVLERIEKLGGEYVTQPEGPAWLHRLIGDDYAEVVRVSFDTQEARRKLRDEHLAVLKGLPELKHLSLHGCDRITDAGLAHLKGLVRLKRLSLHGTKVTGSGLVHLRGAKDLQVLSLQSSQLQGEYLDRLNEFKQLRDLNLRAIPAKGRLYLHDLPKLKSLNLAYVSGLTELHLENLPDLVDLQTSLLRRAPARITLRRLAKLTQVRIDAYHFAKRKPAIVIESLPKLTHVRLRNTGNLRIIRTPQITDLRLRLTEPLPIADIAPLAQLENARLYGLADTPIPLSQWPKLRLLMTDGRIDPAELENVSPTLQVLQGDATHWTDGGLRPLRNHATLHNIRVRNARNITDKGLAHLATIKKLDYLDLPGAQITDDGLIRLSGLSALESVDLSGNKRITGVGLRHLAGLPQLKYLQLANCNIDDNGVGYLKDLPALSSVELDRNPITDEGLKKLVDMPTLGSINLGGCKAITQSAIDAWLATRTRNIAMIKPDGDSLRYSPRRKPRPTPKTPAIGGAGM